MDPSKEAAPAPRLAPAQPADPLGLVDYAPEAIVSRTLVSGKTGSVTLFAFDGGQQLSEHTAPFDALVHVLEGEAQVTIGGKPVPVGTGRMVLMPAGIPHAVLATGRFKMLLTMIRA